MNSEGYLLGPVQKNSKASKATAQPTAPIFSQVHVLHSRVEGSLPNVPLMILMETSDSASRFNPRRVLDFLLGSSQIETVANKGLPKQEPRYTAVISVR